MNLVTHRLESFDRSQALASEELLSQLYDYLRRIAGDMMKQEGPNHTVQPTAFVHEAWIRLTESRSQQWESRSQFLRAAAEIRRLVLVDHALVHPLGVHVDFDRSTTRRHSFENSFPKLITSFLDSALSVAAERDSADFRNARTASRQYGPWVSVVNPSMV